MERKSVFAVAFAIVLCSCAQFQSLTPAGRQVFLFQGEPNNTCTFIGLVSGEHDGGLGPDTDIKGSYNKIRNNASSIGANSIRVNYHSLRYKGGASLSGSAYKCQSGDGMEPENYDFGPDLARYNAEKAERSRLWLGVAQAMVDGYNRGSTTYGYPNSFGAIPQVPPVDSSQFDSASESRIRVPASAGNMGCGLKPIPPIGAHIGRCIDGQWEVVSNPSNSQLDCGLRPIPPVGHHIGRCVDGQWEIVSDPGNSQLNCGIRPIPSLGCRIGACVNGSWQQICN